MDVTVECNLKGAESSAGTQASWALGGGGGVTEEHMKQSIAREE